MAEAFIALGNAYCRIGRHNLLVSQVGIAGSTDTGGVTQPGLSAPVQLPQQAYGGAPVAISGGS